MGIAHHGSLSSGTSSSRAALSPRTGGELTDFPQDVAPAAALPRGIQQSHQSKPGEDAFAALGLRWRLLAKRYLQQRTGQIDAAQPRIHRFDKAGIGVDEMRRLRCLVQDVVERQSAVPCQRLSDSL